MSEPNIVILVIEDESHISKLLEINLKMEGYTPVICDQGYEGLQIIKSQRIDLVILDVMLPDSNGVDICRQIKHARKDTPVIMLSALGQSADKIKGLKSGADDYIAKPFNLEELLLRIEKLLGRFQANTTTFTGNIFSIGPCTIYVDQFELEKNGSAHALSAKELALLKYMYERKNEVISRQEILENVWGYDVYPNTRTIDNMISSFRKYVEDDSVQPQFFKSIRGVGYKLSV